MFRIYRKIACFFFLILEALSPAPSRAEEMPLGYALLPGGTYFYQGETAKGALFAVPETGLIALGVAESPNLASQGGVPEINVPLLLGAQLYVVDKWSYYQRRMILFNDENPSAVPPVDRTSLGDLLLAPFRPSVVSSPVVIISGLLGVADGLYGYPKRSGTFSNISSVTAMNQHMSRDSGTAYYEGASFAVSYGAGVSEEMVFRGMLLPILDYKYDQRTGLWVSSLSFGLLHSLNPGAGGIYVPAQATALGLLFGWQVQEDGYRISKAIAAHFWFDFISSTTTWLANPTQNPLGVQVALGF
ncbi:MAG: CPBP family intramembrane metalloprotease [Nitrospinae bacterium]|nr:CPBP family intramembrane metalloprotease [Nitrospinota bacterium]